MSKMTPREAFNHILYELNRDKDDKQLFSEEEQLQDRLVIKSLVEKSEPKMVVGVRINGGASTVCPVCATFIHYGERHCSGCGQALKWEEK